ncbi:MAG: sialidase family protein, partial [Bacteroidota bacterium]|nr:sialidase family protein [Bacteroidota bacterium]
MYSIILLIYSSVYVQGGFPYDEAYTKRKIVRPTYSKTLKRAEKFLDKNIRNARRSGLIKKEITPLEWWKQDFLMTLDPSKGRPTPEVLFPVLQNINTSHKINKRGTPGTKSTPWKSRGPNNVGGRTRALAWDASDSEQLKVFAGGVTGGLWVNADISSANSKWEQVGGIWPNLNVTCIAQDPNDNDIWYVGTGEGFGTTASSSRGFGIFKSTDGGETWSHLSNTSSYFYVNDIVVRDESGTSVVYAGVDILYYQGTYHGNNTTVGLFRSTNGGTSWSNVAPKIPSQSHYHAVSDIEIDADNRLWIGTRKNPYASSSDRGGGRIYYSSNGTSFTESYKNTSALDGRVEMACAPSSSDTLYAVIESGGKEQNVVRSFNGGSSWST